MHYILVKNCGGMWTENDKNLLLKQVKCGWDLGERTSNRKNIQAGDKMLVYISGVTAKYFVGEATAKASAHKLSKAKQKEYNAFPLVGDVDYWFEFRDFEMWKMPLPMSKAITALSFIKNKAVYGTYMMGGVVSIPENDYCELIKIADREGCRGAKPV